MSKLNFLDIAVGIVEASGAFDEAFYKEQLRELGLAESEFIKHYITQGWRMGLNPHPCFDTNFYLESNEDVKTLDIHPFIHYIIYGYKESRYIAPGFYLPDYIKRHPEISGNTNPLKHFSEHYGVEVLDLPLPKGKSSRSRLYVEERELLELAQKKGLFDFEWYVNKYGVDLYTAESAFADYLYKSKFSPVNPSENFDTETYHRMYGDVYHAQMSPLMHYLTSGEGEGRIISPAIQKWLPQQIIETPCWLLKKAKHLKVAVSLHIFYADYIEKFAKALERFPIKVDVFITLTRPELEEKAKLVFSKVKKIKNINLRIVPNRGRNFGPFLVEYSADFKKYDLFCHLHSKKSLYSGREQTQWADYLTEYLLRDSSVITRILNAFIENKELGIYYPTTFWMMPSWVNHITMNKSYLKKWQEELGVSECSDFISYPAGGMFWVRPEAINQILDREYVYEDFPEEPLLNDGSMLHALERVLGLLAEHNGYKQFFYYPTSGQFTSDKSYISLEYQKSLEGMLPYLSEFTHLSFDVFDTLVRRSYTAPDYAKLKLGKELVRENLIEDAKSFVDIRNKAELDLRIRAKFKGDVRIDEIYKEIGSVLKINDKQAQLLMQREFELDLAMILPKDEMVEAFNIFGSNGHVLWVISDTYYTREQVGLMLRKAGVAVPYRLIISSEERKRKDNGTMWQMIKADLNREGVSSYIHIGDNVVADSQRPGDLGLNTLHVLNPMDKWQLLKFPEVIDGFRSLDEAHILKWGKLISCIGRTPFLGD